MASGSYNAKTKMSDEDESFEFRSGERKLRVFTTNTINIKSNTIFMTPVLPVSVALILYAMLLNCCTIAQLSWKSMTSEKFSNAETKRFGPADTIHKHTHTHTYVNVYTYMCLDLRQQRPQCFACRRNWTTPSTSGGVYDR